MISDVLVCSEKSLKWLPLDTIQSVFSFSLEFRVCSPFGSVPRLSTVLELLLLWWWCMEWNHFNWLVCHFLYSGRGHVSNGSISFEVVSPLSLSLSLSLSFSIPFLHFLAFCGRIHVPRIDALCSSPHCIDRMVFHSVECR